MDRCDELGLLVFTEIPGWQHIGGEAWKDIAVENVREMVVQYRNHPSVILWGVRINESQDDDALYTRTNALAHELDPYRQTGGVRYLKKSSLLEDVYTYNDFSHDGTNAGCEPKKNITPDLEKGYLISEYNGHMYPTKAFDSEYHRLEHVLRHARVLNDVAAEEGIAGSFGWVFADYNTHKDFGSGDRICYHGVLDMYRNFKPAAWVYAAQQSRTPVLFVTSQMDIGEHPSGNPGKVYIITNADSVKMYLNGVFLHEYTQADSEYNKIAHGPILISDYVGDRVESGEGYKKSKADAVRDILNYSAVYGSNDLPAAIKLKAAKAMALYGLNFADAYQLYGKYIGGWGDSQKTYRFEAYKDGELVQTLVKSPAESLQLCCDVSSTVLTEGDTYDMASVRVSVCDQNGNIAGFCNEPVELSAEGPIEITGPRIMAVRGGLGGCYIRTTGETGKARLTLSNPQTGSVTIEFEVTEK
jgi:beta-galactosidase